LAPGASTTLPLIFNNSNRIRFTFNPRIFIPPPTDTTPPVIGITSPTDGAQVNQSPVTVTGNVSDANTVTVDVNGVAATVTGGTYSASVPLVVGANTLTATATDTDGNTANASVQVTLQAPAQDTAPPAVSILTPVDGGLVTDLRQTIQLSYSDPSGVDTNSVTFTVNGASIAVDCSGLGANGGICTPQVDYPEGPVTLIVSIADLLGNTGTVQIQFTVDSTPVDLGFTSPQDGLITQASDVAVTGFAGPDVITVRVNGVDAVVSLGSFSATIPLREGKNMLVAVGTKASGKTGTATVDVTRDNQAPTVRIQSPSDGFVSIQDKIAVTGSVNDIVNGATNATVFVNGVEATVSNGAFMLMDLPLVRGPNTLTAVATDRVGNQGSHSITVTFQQAVGVRMNKMSGDGQAVLVSQQAPQPLVVVVTDDLGNPVAGRQVEFEVTRNNGVLDANGNGVFNRTQRVITDGSGKASVFLRLGDSAGEGNNRVLASAVGVLGQVEFCASGLPASADRIVTVDGDNQRGTTGNPLPNPLEAFVVDKDGNPVSNVDVTFSVVQGGGALNGASSLVRKTGADGIARAVLTLGTIPGINNNVVNAAFAVDQRSRDLCVVRVGARQPGRHPVPGRGARQRPDADSGSGREYPQYRDQRDHGLGRPVSAEQCAGRTDRTRYRPEQQPAARDFSDSRVRNHDDCGAGEHPGPADHPAVLEQFGPNRRRQPGCDPDHARRRGARADGVRELGDLPRWINHRPGFDQPGPSRQGPDAAAERDNLHAARVDRPTARNPFQSARADHDPE
jgi:hypothetical protein